MVSQIKRYPNKLFAFPASLVILLLSLSLNTKANHDIDSLKLAYDYADVLEERISTQILIGHQMMINQPTVLIKKQVV